MIASLTEPRGGRARSAGVSDSPPPTMMLIDVLLPSESVTVTTSVEPPVNPA